MSTAAQDFITEAKAENKINAYEVFCTSFSQIIYAASLRDAVKGFEENNPKEYAIMAQNTEYSRIEREKGEREAPAMIEISEYKAACKEIESLQDQLKDAEREISDLQNELRNT